MKNEDRWPVLKAILDKLKEDNLISHYVWYHTLLNMRKELNLPIVK